MMNIIKAKAVLHRILSIGLTLLVLGAFAQSASAENTTNNVILPSSLTFSTSSHAAVVHYYQPLIEVAYERLGIPVEFLQLNEERSIRLLDKGRIDGDTIRTQNIHKKGSKFVPVYMLGDAKVYLVCQAGIQCSTDILQNPNYSLGSVGGSSHFDELLKSAKINQLRYTDYDLLRRSFRQGKVDVYIEVMSTHYHQMHFPKRANVAYLQTIKGFHFLHERYAHLAPKVAKEIQTLQNELHNEDNQCWMRLATLRENVDEAPSNSTEQQRSKPQKVLSVH